MAFKQLKLVYIYTNLTIYSWYYRQHLVFVTDTPPNAFLLLHCEVLVTWKVTVHKIRITPSLSLSLSLSFSLSLSLGYGSKFGT